LETMKAKKHGVEFYQRLLPETSKVEESLLCD
jgi:hypothetical protein